MLNLVLRISRWIAFALLALSLVLPWFRVPVGVREDLNGVPKILFAEPASTIGFKIFLLSIVVITSWLGIRRRRSGATDWARPLTVGGFVLLLVLGITYPAVTMQRCAAISAHAAWLQAQNYSLILPFGDAYRAQEYSHEPGQSLISVADVLPRAFEAIPTPVVNCFADFSLGRLEEVLMWLGLSPAFCQFVYRGWFCGIFGAFLLAASFVRVWGAQGGSDKVQLSAGVPAVLVFGATLLYILWLTPIVMAGRQLTRARTALSEGRLSESLDHLERMEAWLPVLAYNSDVLFQRGWLDQKLGIQSDVAMLYSAMREEEEDFDSRAVQHYSELLARQPIGPVRDEACRGVLRLAIKDFNSGLIDRAADRLRQLEATDPSCIKANYALQLAYLQSYRKEELDGEIARFEALYTCFQSLEKSGLIAAAHRRAAELDFQFRDIAKLGDEMRAAIKP
jgi:tetratricopeptide (TPR) repeat protein